MGDRQTGKSTIDTIINQKANWATGDPKQQVKRIYVAVDQKGTTIPTLAAGRTRAAGTATLRRALAGPTQVACVDA